MKYELKSKVRIQETMLKDSNPFYSSKQFIQEKKIDPKIISRRKKRIILNRLKSATTVLSVRKYLFVWLNQYLTCI